MSKWQPVKTAYGALAGLLGRPDVTRFLSLSGWTVLSFSIYRVTQITLLILLAHRVPTNVYGQLIITQGMIALCESFIISGVGPYLSKYLPAGMIVSKARVSQISTVAIVIVTILMSAVLLFIPILHDIYARNVVNTDVSTAAFAALIGWIIATSISNLLTVTLTALERAASISVASVGASLFGIAVIPWVNEGGTLQTLLFSYALMELLRAALIVISYCLHLSREGIRLFTWPAKEDALAFMGLGGSTLATAVLYTGTFWAGQLFLKHGSPNGSVEVGILGYAYSYMSAILLLGALTNQAALPIMAGFYAKGQSKRLKKWSFNLAWIQFAFSAVLSMPIIFYSDGIMGLMKAEYAEKYPILVTLIFSGIVISMQNCLGNYLLIVGRQNFLLLSLVIWSLVFLAGLGLGAERGAIAFAESLAVASVLRTLLIGVRWKLA